MAISVRDNRGGNWFWIHNVVVTDYGKHLGPHGLAIYAALACHADKEQQTWVSQKALAEEVGSSRAQVQRELAKLKQLGLVEVEEKTNEHGQTSNIYVAACDGRCGTGQSRRRSRWRPRRAAGR